MEKIRGVVDSVYQHRPGAAWGLATIMTKEGQPVPANGGVGMLKVGEEVEVAGAWDKHPKYGKQFKVKLVTVIEPTTKTGIARYLALEVAGLGPKSASRVCNFFGDDVLAILDKDPERLREVEGLRSMDGIIESYKAARAGGTHERDLIMLLESAGIGPKHSRSIAKQLGKDGAEQIREDPYQLMSLAGVGFKLCDQLADGLDIPKNDPRRLRAAILYHFTRECSEKGHTHLPTEGIMDKIHELLGNVDMQEARDAMKALLKMERLIHEDGRLYERPIYEAEIKVAKWLARIAGNSRPTPDAIEAADHVIADIAAKEGFELSDEQAKAVLASAKGGITVLTGGPGTGKTAATKAIVQALGRLAVDYAICAPTGKAAVRSTEATGVRASTVHMLLGFAGNEFGYNAKNPLPNDAVIVDECSMVDLKLMRALLAALPEEATLVLVGDIDQLPSVGAGNVLRDVIDSGVANVVRLGHIYRQGEGSPIPVASADVNKGRIPIGGPLPKSGFYVDKYKDGASAADRVVDMVKRANELWGVDPVKDVQVLTPMKAHKCGVNELNKRLQEALNPVEFGTPVHTRGKVSFRPGDKVMQTKNDYGRIVFNGMSGLIAEVHPRDNPDAILTVDFGDRPDPVAYDNEDLANLVLAYAATIHKSQGSQFPVVVLPLDSSHWFMHWRSIIYTGMTRASQACALVGDIRKAHSRYRSKIGEDRTTFLAERIKAEVRARRGGQ